MMKHLKNIASQSKFITNSFVVSTSLVREAYSWENIMKAGTILNGYSVGKNNRYKYILRECSNCSQKKWISLSDTNRRKHSRLCRSCSKKGKNNPPWKGGRTIGMGGYVLILKPGHPLAYDNGYVKEHRLVAYEKWGIDAVRNMDVHHINGVKTDNRIINLEIMTHSKHMSLHRRREEALRKTISKTTRSEYTN